MAKARKRAAEVLELTPDEPEVNTSGDETEADGPPQAPGKEKDPFLWMSQQSADEWTRLCVYVYRVAPFWLAEATGGKHHYIAKFVNPFTQDELMKQHGSGVYRFDITRIRHTGGSARIRQDYAHILNPDYPPHLPLGDWLNDPKNKDWKWCEDPIRRKNAAANASAPQQQQPQFTQQQPAPPPPPASPAHDPAISDLLRRQGEQLMQLTNPAHQLDTITKLMSIARPADNGSSELMQMFRDTMKQNHEQLLLMQKQIATLQAPPATPPTAQKSMFEMLLEEAPKIEQVAAMLGYKKQTGEDAEESNPWVRLFDRMIDAAPAVAEMFVAQRQEQPPTQPGPVTIQAQAQPQQQQQQQPAAQPAQGADQVTPANAPPQTNADKIKTYEPLIRAAAPELIKALRMKTPAADMRAWFKEQYGGINFDVFKREIGADLLATEATAHPALKMMLPDREVVAAFLHEFFETTPEEARPA